MTGLESRGFARRFVRAPLASFPRKRESGRFNVLPSYGWIPACAGMTGSELAGKAGSKVQGFEGSRVREPERSRLGSACFCAALLLISVTAHGADKPYQVTSRNADEYKSLLPAPIYARVKRGQYSLSVVPVDAARFRANYTEGFWRASAANKGKFAIDGATGGLIDVATGAIPQRVFGLPFPEVAAGDALAGAKIIHNYRFRRTQADGTIHYFDLSDVTVTGDVIRTVKIFTSERFYVGSTTPAPQPLPDNTEWRQLAAAVEPKEVEGVGVLTWRFHDWKTWDQVWAYVPSIRRVRRMRTALRSERIPGFEVHGDDADCYDGKVSYFEWKLAGSGEIIGPVGSDTPYAYTLEKESPTRWFMELPYINAVYETPKAKGAGWFTLKNVYVRRPVWIVEGTPRDPYYEAGKIVLYIDRELYHGYYKLAYSKAGEQYQTNFCGSAWGRTPDGSFAAPSSLLMIGVNEKEDRGTPTGRYIRETFERGFADNWFTAEHLRQLSGSE
jgi:hypothetical protein